MRERRFDHPRQPGIDEEIPPARVRRDDRLPLPSRIGGRSEEHKSELQSLMRISYAVFCLQKQQSQYANPNHFLPLRTTTTPRTIFLSIQRHTAHTAINHRPFTI